MKNIVNAAHASAPTLFISLISLSIAVPFNAETYVLDELVITASRVQQPLSSVMQPVTVISETEIQDSDALSLGELLAQFTDIDVSYNGGINKSQTTTVSGSSNRHVLVLVDGVKMDSATLGENDWKFLPVNGLEKIELLKGAQSNAYGSSAIGGVINVFTKKDTHTHASIALGSHDTQRFSVSKGVKRERANFSVMFNRLQTAGFDSLSAGDDDDDGMDKTEVRVAGSIQIKPQQRLSMGVSRVEGKDEYDSAFGGIDPVAKFSQTTWNAALSTAHNAKLNTQLRLSGVDRTDDTSATSSANIIDNQRLSFSAQADYQPRPDVLMLMGVDVERDKVNNSSTEYEKKQADNHGLFVNLQKTFGQHKWEVGLRSDDAEGHDKQTSRRLGYAYKTQAGVLLGGSYANAYKRPSFNDLYWPSGPYSVGNPELKPEASETIDAHIRYPLNINGAVNGRIQARAFRSKVKDLINWTSDPDTFIWSPNNVSEASIEGVEVSTKLTTKGGWKTRINAGVWEPKDKGTGKTLAKRLKQRLNLSVDKDFGTHQLGVDWRAVGTRDKGNADELPGYAKLDLRIAKKLSKHTKLSLKMSNELDKDYQNTKGYNTEGRSFMLTLSYDK